MHIYTFCSMFLCKDLPSLATTPPHIKATWCGIDMIPDGVEITINSYIWYNRQPKHFIS